MQSFFEAGILLFYTVPGVDTSTVAWGRHCLEQPLSTTAIAWNSHCSLQPPPRATTAQGNHSLVQPLPPSITAPINHRSGSHCPGTYPSPQSRPRQSLPTTVTAHHSNCLGGNWVGGNRLGRGGGKFFLGVGAGNALSHARCAIIHAGMYYKIHPTINAKTSLHSSPRRDMVGAIGWVNQGAPPMDLDAQIDLRDNAEEALFAELMTPSAPRTPAPRQAIQKVHYSHDAMIDQIIANPAISQNELASIFGYSVGWISQVVNSDAFQARLAQRKAELTDPILIESLELQFKGILSLGLEKMRNRLEQEEVPDNFVLRSVDLASRSLGYGAKKDQTPPESNLNEKLVDLSQNLVALMRKTRNPSEGRVIDIGEAE